MLADFRPQSPPFDRIESTFIFADKDQLPPAMRGDLGETLLPRDIVGTAIYERCVVHKQPIDEMRCTRRSLKVTSGIFSISSKLIFVPIALQMQYGPLFAVGSTVSFTCLEFWAIGGSIDEFAGKKTNHEYILLERAGNGKCYIIAVLTSAAVLAILSEVSGALPSFDYSPGMWKVPGFIVSIVAGSLLTTRSLHLTFNRIVQNSRKKKFEAVGQQIERIREEVIDLVRNNQSIFRKMDFQKKVAYVQMLNALRNENDEENVPSEYWEKMLLEGAVAPYEDGICDNLGTGFGVALNIILQAGRSHYAYKKTEEHLVKDPGGAGTLTGASILTGLYLSTMAISGISQRIWRSFCDCLRRRRDPDISMQLRPKIALVSKFIGLLLNIAAVGPLWKVWGEFYSYTVMQSFMQTTCSGAVLLMLMIATFDLIDECIIAHINCCGDPNEKDIIKLYQEMRALQELLSKSSHLDFVFLLANLPPGSKDKLLRKLNLQIEAFDDYKNRFLTE